MNDELTPFQELALHAEFKSRLDRAESWACIEVPASMSPVGGDIAAELERLRNAFIASFGIPPHVFDAAMDGVSYSEARIRIATHQFHRFLPKYQ